MHFEYDLKINELGKYMNTFPDLIAENIGWYIWNNSRWQLINEYNNRISCWFPSANDYRMVWKNDDGTIGSFQWRTSNFFTNQWIHNCKLGRVNWLVPDRYLDGIGASRENQSGKNKKLRYNIESFIP
jgi:hypothetical protein